MAYIYQSEGGYCKLKVQQGEYNLCVRDSPYGFHIVFYSHERGLL